MKTKEEIIELLRTDVQAFNAYRQQLIEQEIYDLDLNHVGLGDTDLRYANLSGANLRGATLWNADLRNADLSGADLGNADLSDTDLGNAILWNSDLSGANLRYANLENANLWDAKLSNADLKGADLRGTILRDANLRGANLSNANLSGVDLRDTNLSRANLRGANLSNANLSGTKLRDAHLENANIENTNLSFFKIINEGDIIGYKKMWSESRYALIISLKILKNFKRINKIGSRKCRAEKAIFNKIETTYEELFVEDLSVPYYFGIHDIHSFFKKGNSFYNEEYEYTLEEGFEIIPDSYDDDVRVECSNGIHFFITKKEAENY